VTRRERGAPAHPRGPAEGEALPRAQRKFALNRRAHRRALVITIVMGVIAAGCLVTWIAVLNSQAVQWPWGIGLLLSLAIGVYTFATQSRLLACPHCRTHLLGFGQHCPYCGAGITGQESACPWCRAPFANVPSLRHVAWCSTCGTALASARSPSKPVPVVESGADA
jgi:hypothetical protein